MSNICKKNQIYHGGVYHTPSIRQSFDCIQGGYYIYLKVCTKDIVASEDVEIHKEHRVFINHHVEVEFRETIFLEKQEWLKWCFQQGKTAQVIIGLFGLYGTTCLWIRVLD